MISQTARNSLHGQAGGRGSILRGVKPVKRRVDNSLPPDDIWPPISPQ